MKTLFTLLLFCISTQTFADNFGEILIEGLVYGTVSSMIRPNYSPYYQQPQPVYVPTPVYIQPQYYYPQRSYYTHERDYNSRREYHGYYDRD